MNRSANSSSSVVKNLANGFGGPWFEPWTELVETPIFRGGGAGV